VAGQVNSCAPRVFGDGIIHISQFNALVKADVPLPEMAVTQPSKAEDFIGKLLTDNLIEDGATLQLGLFNPLKGRDVSLLHVAIQVYRNLHF